MTAIPEVQAAERIAAVVATHLQPAWLTERALRDIGMKVVAHRPFIRGIFDELDQDPKRLRDRDVVLRGQQTAATDDGDWWLEQLAYHEHAAEECRAVLAKMPVHRDLYDPDQRGADEDDRRISQERRDEAAIANAPRGIAS